MTREKALAQLRNGPGIDEDASEEYNKAVDIAIKALEQEPQTRWISVSDRLPEKDGDYLVTIKWKGSYSGDVYTEVNMAVYKEKEKEWDCAGIVAWMPLPLPWKGE